ncbi:hypothetical protein PAXRUDRAFT_12993 [Paxillus rubicundulus Ve08.2h10]|uniref:Uncharacterized protein n=1 Tax=Paxillus rubicundulus Ve08.2h10 TaxID=930991 RepID=A0A0D0DMH6_9AGAM|nr:hypothetical protein PAXRUDRAFT_12993 [Paxillus rubicundulus Ve08.2h10]
MGGPTNGIGELPQNPSFHSELPQASILFSPTHGLLGSHHPSQLPPCDVMDNWGDMISWEDTPQQEYENRLLMWLGSHAEEEVMGMGFEDFEGLPQAQHNDNVAGLYHGQQEAVKGMAGFHYRQHGASSHENAQLNDLQDYFTNGKWTTDIPSSWNENMAASHHKEIPVNKLHLMQKLMEVMLHTWFTFQAHVSCTVELSFKLVPEILGGPNDKMHKQEAIKKLLDGDWIEVLHCVEKSPDSDDMLVHYFKNRVIVNKIIYVIWRELGCSDLVDELKMDPVFRLASAAFKTVFLEHADGIYKKCPAHAEQFTEAYEEMINFITNMWPLVSEDDEDGGYY